MLQVNYTSKVNKLIEKETRFVVSRGREQGQVDLDVGSQKVQTFSYKTKMYQGYNV